MPRPKVESRPRVWPRVIVLALVGVAAAGCSDSARFNSYTTDRPPQNMAAAAPAYAPSARVEAQPLPAPSQPATVAAAPAPAYGGQSLGTYRSNDRYSDVTGSVANTPTQSGHWTWNGGSPVTVRYGETVDSIARQNGVPASAIMQTNGIREPGQIQAWSAPGHPAVCLGHREERSCLRASTGVCGRKCSCREVG